jgi:hypothetical protein
MRIPDKLHRDFASLRTGMVAQALQIRGLLGSSLARFYVPDSGSSATFLYLAQSSGYLSRNRLPITSLARAIPKPVVSR